MSDKRPRGDNYDAYRESQAAISRARSAAGREIGPLPAVANPERKARARASLRVFCETYFPGRFRLGWSADHLEVLAALERCVTAGGLFALAMPRGSGKSTLCECAALYGVLYGFRRFVMLVGATETHAENMLDSIKAEVESNDLLAEDFPEVCHPVRKLEGINNRANGQTLDGERTRISWTAREVVLPTVAGAAGSGAVIRVAGITGAIRGAKHTGADGVPIRPDVAIIDDPQTKESARSPSQNAHRESVIAGDVLGLPGPDGAPMAAVMPCTVVAPGDLADRMLDRESHPDWQGRRFRMVSRWPDRMDLWDQYAELRREELRAGGDGSKATEFYRQHRAEMDAGAAVGWPERFKDGELSALQSAFNIRIRNPREFDAEYQNDPQADDAGGRVKQLDADEIAAKVNRVPRREVPRECSRLTAFIDCGGKVLWYAVCGWDERFGGAVIDYGTYPGQSRAYFAADDVRPGLPDLPEMKGFSEGQMVYAGLRALTEAVLGRNYQRHETGEPLSIERCLVDAGWLPDVVHQCCRESRFAALLTPSKGYAVGSNAKPIDEWTRRTGERSGRGWRIGPVGGGRGRQCTFDPDHWKSFVADRLTTPPGGAGCLQLFGEGKGAHQLFADHLTAETAEPVTSRGRTYDKWTIRPGRPDNHWWDCLVGCAVAASVQGLLWSPGGEAGPRKPATPRPKFSEMQARKRQQGGR